MMNRNKKIIEEVNKTISLLDKVEIIEANPFLLTRIKAELEANNKKPKLKFYEIFLKVLSPVIIALLLLVNIYSALSFVKAQETTEKARQQQYINYIVSEYSLNQVNDYLTNYEVKE